MKQRGRPIRGLIGGFLLGFFLSLDLALTGAVQFDSAVLTILPFVFMVIGLLLGLWAPIGRKRGGDTRTAAPLPDPKPWPASAPVEGSTAPPAPAPPPPRRTATRPTTTGPTTTGPTTTGRAADLT